jgi:hypothetical protein
MNSFFCSSGCLVKLVCLLLLVLFLAILIEAIMRMVIRASRAMPPIIPPTIAPMLTSEFRSVMQNNNSYVTQRQKEYNLLNNNKK